MKKLAALSLLLAQATAFTPAFAREAPQPAVLDVTVKGVADEKPIPSKYAFCMPDGKGESKDGGNISPAISWSGAPRGTRSYAIIMSDPDVPATFDLANQKGKVVPAVFRRQMFYHWVLVNIPARTTHLAEGQASKGVTKGGKKTGKLAYGLTGRNDYAKFMKGENSHGWGGYDGPCPPWNDELLHHYHFAVYALDVASLPLAGAFTGPDAEKAMQGHVIGRGEVIGTYTDNADLLAK